MDKIKNFTYQVRSNSDDSKNIDEQLSIFDLLPDRVSWFCDDENYLVKNEDKIIALLLKEVDQIAIIEAPFGPERNEAYIVDSKGETLMNVSKLLKEKYRSIFYNKVPVFSDVYYVYSSLFFFLEVNGVDFRIEVDLIKRSIGELIESR